MHSYRIFEMANGRPVITRQFPSITEAGEKRRRLEAKLGRDLGLMRELDPATDDAHIVKMVRRFRREMPA